MFTTSSWLMLFGAILVLIGSVIRWKVSAYDLKDAAIDSAWTLARGKRTADNPRRWKPSIATSRASRPGPVRPPGPPARWPATSSRRCWASPR